MELDRIARMVRELKCDPVYAMFRRITEVFYGPKPEDEEPAPLPETDPDEVQAVV